MIVGGGRDENGTRYPSVRVHRIHSWALILVHSTQEFESLPHISSGDRTKIVRLEGGLHTPDGGVELNGGDSFGLTTTPAAIGLFRVLVDIRGSS